MIDKFRKNAAHGKQPFGIGTVSAIDPDQVRRDRMKLRENGFSPIPNYDKTTLLKGWPRVEITGEVIGEWARKHGRWLATGLRIENGLVAVDLDVDDGPMVERLAVVLQDIVPELADERVPWLERSSGRAKVAWFFRTDEAFGRLYTRRWLKPGETAEADATQFVEIFGGASARQFGAFGPHTRLDNGEVTRWYAWRDLSPLDVPLGRLPIITKKQFSDFCDAAEREFEVAGWSPVPMSVAGESMASGVYDLTDAMMFNCSDGVSRTLDSLRAVAGMGNIRCSASWLDGPSAKRTDRCLVSLMRSGHVAIWETASGVTHIEKAAMPVKIDQEEVRRKLAGARVAAPKW